MPLSCKEFSLRGTDNPALRIATFRALWRSHLQNFFVPRARLVLALSSGMNEPTRARATLRG